MGLNDLAIHAADMAFISKERSLVAWDSAPGRVSIPGKLRGTRSKAIVTVVQREEDLFRVDIHGPRNLTVSQEIRVPEQEDELDQILCDGLRQLHSTITSGSPTLRTRIDSTRAKISGRSGKQTP